MNKVLLALITLVLVVSAGCLTPEEEAERDLRDELEGNSTWIVEVDDDSFFGGIDWYYTNVEPESRGRCFYIQDAAYRISWTQAWFVDDIMECRNLRYYMR